MRRNWYAAPVIAPLPCEEIVLRAITKSGWLNLDGRLNHNAFIRDPKKDSDGLSVNLRSRTDLPAWLSGVFDKSWGADSLHSGRIRTLGLEVGQTAKDLAEQSDHGVIDGLPFSDDDPERAEYLAGQLARMSRQVDRVKRRK